MLFLQCSYFLCYHLTFTHRSVAEVYTATSELAPLREKLDQLIDDLEYYINEEKKRMKELLMLLNIYKREQFLISQDTEYLENPINAFILIKRLTADLNFTKQNILKTLEYSNTINLRHMSLIYPTSEDLTGSALALARLQDTYQLNATEIAEVRFTGNTSNSMTTSDCFKLGQVLFEEKSYQLALQWLIEALRKYKMENDSFDYSKKANYNYIIHSLRSLGDVKMISKLSHIISTLDPNHLDPFKDIVITRQETIDGGQKTFIKGYQSETEGNNDTLTKFMKIEKQVYGALCRGDIELPEKMSKRLKCRYLRENHPFLKLAPIKMEQVYIEPDVFLFHQVMSDAEIEHVKNIAKPRFQRSVIVAGPKNRRSIPAKHRISKTSWLYDYQSPVLNRITQRIADFTGLCTSTAEPLQVVNYGIGGHFAPHFDFSMKSQKAGKELKMIKFGNRIATVLFYMSDVARGGATVFTELGLSVFPVKNAAVFWMNLHPSGEGDIATRHAACPVLRGSKWVSNKWIHQIGQETIKPCNLEYQKEQVKRKFPKPFIKSTNMEHRQLLHNWYYHNGIHNIINYGL